jgi:beta-N-acetylhexosaminidase
VTRGPGELLAIGFDGLELPSDVIELAEAGGLGGVILFARNCPTLEAVLALTDACRRLGPEVLVLVDHEGGRVHRLPPPFTRFPPAAAVGRGGDPSLAAAVARAMARELRAAGFDSGLTPVLDCLTEPGCTVIGDRAFGRDPELVAACGVAFVEAALTEGLVPVAKHFPGHGRTTIDSHVALPEIHASAETLDAVELLPFRRALAAGCPAVMVAHARYPALDPGWPASLSGLVVGGLLRDRLEFGGLVVSDDLEMDAVARTWGVGAAAARFLEAGGDLAIVSRDAAARRDAAAAVGTAIDQGRLSVADPARRRDRVRRLAAGPRPGIPVIGCAEHRELAEEVARRGGSAPL